MQIVIEIDEKTYNVIKGFGDIPIDDTYDVAMAIINGTPLPKGHWIEERLYIECPNCHDVWFYEQNQTESFNYCPNCGADMRGDDNG